MKPTINKKTVFIITALLLVFFLLYFVIAQPDIKGHSVDEISGLDNFFITNGNLSAIPNQVCDSGKCINSINSTGGIFCIAPQSTLGKWMPVDTTNFYSCTQSCQNIGYAYATFDPATGKRCKGTDQKFGDYVINRGCYNHGPVISCYCKYPIIAATCPPISPSEPTHTCTFNERLSTLHDATCGNLDVMGCSGSSSSYWAYDAPVPSNVQFENGELVGKTTCHGFSFTYKCLIGCT